MSRATRRVAQSLRSHSLRVVNVLGPTPPKLAIVKHAQPLVVTLTDHKIEIGQPELILTQAVRQYDQEFGIAVGDSLVLMKTLSGDWIVTDVVSLTPMSPGPTPGGAFEILGGPPVSLTADGDFRVLPITTKWAGSDLIDFSNPVRPTWLVEGTFIVTATLQGGLGLTAGQFYIGQLVVGGLQENHHSAPSNGSTYVTPTLLLVCPGPVTVGYPLVVQAAARGEGSDFSVLMVTMNIQQV